MRSLRFAQLLHHQAGLGLKEAWDIKIRVLDKEPVVLELPAAMATAIFEQTTALGVICTLEANPLSNRTACRSLKRSWLLQNSEEGPKKLLEPTSSAEKGP